MQGVDTTDEQVSGACLWAEVPPSAACREPIGSPCSRREEPSKAPRDTFACRRRGVGEPEHSLGCGVQVLGEWRRSARVERLVGAARHREAAYVTVVGSVEPRREAAADTSGTQHPTPHGEAQLDALRRPGVVRRPRVERPCSTRDGECLGVRAVVEGVVGTTELRVVRRKAFGLAVRASSNRIVR